MIAARRKIILPSFATRLCKAFDIRPGEERQVLLMATLLFFLLAANNVIKIVRDALFLSRFPITQLPYVYLLAAFVAGVSIAVYARATVRLTLSHIVLGSLGFTITSAIGFWFLVVFAADGWVFYAYYIWSAIAGLVLVAQFWMVANGLFNPRDGKRLFGVVTAGGTIGATAGGLAANWLVRTLFGSEHLLWFVVGLLAAAFVLTGRVLGEPHSAMLSRADPRVSASQPSKSEDSILRTVLGSSHLKIIAALLFVSVVVSTLIDYQFKAAAKGTYLTADTLAQFFGSYYAWLGAATLAAQLWLTGKLLVGLGLTPSLLFLPSTLLVGSFGLLLWPGLAAATATRMAEATLRTSVHQSGMQILFLPVGDAIKKRVKVFLDVTVERLGDGVAALIILAVVLVLGAGSAASLSYVAIVLVALWLALVLRAQRGYLDALRASLSYREMAFEGGRIEFTDRATLQAVLSTLHGKSESAILFALELAEKMDRQFVIAHLPPALLRHESTEVRRRAVALLLSPLEDNAAALLFEALTAQRAPLRTEVIEALSARLRRAGVTGAPHEHPEGAGSLQLHREALDSLRRLLADQSAAGEKDRIEAVRAMGEWAAPELVEYLAGAIRTDRSPAVVRAALLAAAKGKYPELIQETIARLGTNATRAAARAALIQYGEIAIKGLRAALSDDRVAREIRLAIPATLSKIPAQAAMNALMGGLLEEDRAVRFKAILAAAEMSRRFADLKVDRDVVESAIMSDAQLYCRRLILFAALFEPANDAGSSLLYHALRESLERVLERVIWLLALIYPASDIRRAWTGLKSSDRLQRAHATEFIDNLLTGDIKKHMLPLYSDAPPEQRLRAARDALGMDPVDSDGALRTLLAQEDRWLKVAALWEIGLRKASGFGAAVEQLSQSEDALVRETAAIVAQGQGAP